MPTPKSHDSGAPTSHSRPSNDEASIINLSAETQVGTAAFTKLSELANYYESRWPHLSMKEILFYVVEAIGQQEQQKPYPYTSQQIPNTYIFNPMVYNQALPSGAQYFSD